MLAAIFIVSLIGGIFAFERIAFWWRQNEWKGRWRRGDDE
jgi:hypothetical protein